MKGIKSLVTRKIEFERRDKSESLALLEILTSETSLRDIKNDIF